MQSSLCPCRNAYKCVYTEVSIRIEHSLYVASHAFQLSLSLPIVFVLSSLCYSVSPGYGSIYSAIRRSVDYLVGSYELRFAFFFSFVGQSLISLY